MAFTYDLDTNTGKVRLLAVDSRSDSYLFADEEIDTFLSLQANSVFRGAALALETIAADQALCLKRITSLDLSTDGPATAAALRDQAKVLREQAKEAEAREENGLFDIAEMVYDNFTRRERWWNEVQRQNP